MSTGHQPGVFKRPAKAHKTFKGKRSKGQIDAENRGRVGVTAVIRSRKRLLSKEERHHKAAQIRANKRRAVIERRRGLDGGVAAPTLVTVISFGSSASDFVKTVAKCDDTIVHTQGHNVDYFAIPRFKSRLGLLTPDLSKHDNILDSIKTVISFGSSASDFVKSVAKCDDTIVHTQGHNVDYFALVLRLTYYGCKA
ncbi:unnamed protein product [Strongylus vulgaris]|uniref:Uncharacterized protein n=1 Tax=Strongylus vulgaris TaxID=40348 RepID=A0A3P7JTU9_STRVU|nr:unnamed protein product [Strongylus vulgaris]